MDDIWQSLDAQLDAMTEVEHDKYIQHRLRKCQRLGKTPKRGAPTIIHPDKAAEFKLCLRLRREHIKIHKLRETPRASMMTVAVHCNIDTDDSRILERLIQIAESRDSVVNREATKKERKLPPEALAQLSKRITSLQPHKRR
ncbi:MAG: hypothetical protein CFE29_14080 [Bradyrhizobiaceae bacterium PARB1]|jgi:hypothetical protein|nr:MAG: hypothetical protein CFE29_14080 [Bradyrhizobiaceae bacterium PARB1]